MFLKQSMSILENLKSTVPKEMSSDGGQFVFDNNHKISQKLVCFTHLLTKNRLAKNVLQSLSGEERRYFPHLRQHQNSIEFIKNDKNSKVGTRTPCCEAQPALNRITSLPTAPTRSYTKNSTRNFTQRYSKFIEGPGTPD